MKKERKLLNYPVKVKGKLLKSIHLKKPLVRHARIAEDTKKPYSERMAIVISKLSGLPIETIYSLAMVDFYSLIEVYSKLVRGK